MHTAGDVARASNLLGALAIGVGDRLQRATEAVAGRSGARAAALTNLAQWPGDTIEDLRHMVGLTHSATVRVVDGLVADGLVERVPVGGGPAVRPEMTPAGQAEAQKVLAARHDVLDSLVATLSEAEIATFTELAERFLRMLTHDFKAGELICRLCELDACPQERCPVALRQRIHRSPNDHDS
jgi:MarR family transcriptional regulator, negative regulator of the multidrug operon emrRAB